MPLFRRSPLPGPGAPVDEHLDAIAAGRPGAVPAYIRALAARDLWVGAAELPAGIGPGEAWTVTEPITLPLLTTGMPDGSGRALQLFTSQTGVQVRAPQLVPIGLDGRRALDMVVTGYDGAIVDSHARWQGLASAWISEALAAPL